MQTNNGLIDVEYVSHLSAAVFPPADWSIVNCPYDPVLAEKLAKNLYNTPVSNHVSLVVHRHARKNMISSFTSLRAMSDKWDYLNTVTISYPQPNSGSNNGLLPISEVGHIFYKGMLPDAKKTDWFQADAGRANATNFWDLGPQPEEDSALYYQKFSWELNLLLKSLTSPQEHRRFIYAVDTHPDELYSVYNFCETYSMKAKIYVTDQVEFRKHTAVIQNLNKKER